MSKDELKIYTDNGQMKVWASSSYSMMIDDFYDGEITYNVHNSHIVHVNRIKPGNLVETAEGETGLVLEWMSKDMQGFDVYKVMIKGKELFYSTLELDLMENK
jgi:hypothetical protein